MPNTNLRLAIDQRHAKTFDTTALREEVLIDGLWIDDEASLAYTQLSRMICGATPKSGPLTVDGVKQSGSPSRFDRREAALVNLGSTGTIETTSEIYELSITLPVDGGRMGR